MPLDMPTITAVGVAVTAVLGLVLLQSWWRERTSPLTGWWGLAQLIMAAGIAVAGVASYKNDITLVTFGQAIIILSASLMWMSVRQFEGRQFRTLWVLAWPAAFLVIAFSGLLPAFDERLIATCTMLAALRYAAAIELARDGTERLISRWPAVVLLVGLGIGYSAWLPLTLTMPIREACYVFSSTWFPPVVLIALLGRIALAFVVLAMVKEREELKQRHDALTDPLTGLPNRRALFDAAAELARHSKYLKGDPISVLVFDLDHFKKINDTFGHRLGDRVLQLFADTMAEKPGDGQHRRAPGRRGVRSHIARGRSRDGRPNRRVACGSRSPPRPRSSTEPRSQSRSASAPRATTTSIAISARSSIAPTERSTRPRTTGAIGSSSSARRKRCISTMPMPRCGPPSTAATARSFPRSRSGDIRGATGDRRHRQARAVRQRRSGPTLS